MFLFCVFIFSLSFFHFIFIVYLVYDFIINILKSEKHLSKIYLKLKTLWGVYCSFFSRDFCLYVSCSTVVGKHSFVFNRFGRFVASFSVM